MIHRGKENRVAGVMLAGIILLVFASISLVLIGFGGIVLIQVLGKAGLDVLTMVCVMAIAISFILIFAGMSASIMHGRKLGRDITLRTLEHVQIQARFGMDRHQIMQFPDEHIEEAELTYWVRVVDPNWNTYEFKTAPEAYFQCGEGMKGSIRYQGDWLSLFTPEINAGGDQVGADPFLRQ